MILKKSKKSLQYNPQINKQLKLESKKALKKGCIKFGDKQISTTFASALRDKAISSKSNEGEARDTNVIK
jgi:hypothetical protein